MLFFAQKSDSKTRQKFLQIVCVAREGNMECTDLFSVMKPFYVNLFIRYERTGVLIHSCHVEASLPADCLPLADSFSFGLCLGQKVDMTAP